MEKRPGLKRKTCATKIGLVVFLFSTIFSQNTYAVSTTGLNWNNPNRNIGENLYKLSTDNILNSQTLMQVVGCTGVVNDLSGAIIDLLGGEPTLDNAIETLTRSKEKLLAQACNNIKGGIEMSEGGILYTTYTQATSDGYVCPNVQKSENSTVEIQNRKILSQMAKTEKREACFNGLAYTLAKNQLTSMTRETLNWINTGFNGNPLYVQNITSLTQSIERNVIEKNIQQIGQDSYYYPYGADFSQSIVRSYNGGFLNSSTNMLDSLMSDITAFVTDENSYTSNNSNNITTNNYSPSYTPQNAIDTFNDDFSSGGWNAYLAMTQRDANNPLGFTMKAAQYIADKIDQESTETKNEVAQNNGFLSQKECEIWQVYNQYGPVKESNGVSSLSGNITLTTDSDYKYSETKTGPYDQCYRWKVVTPGSIIKDKLSTYINSPERQLELADNINDVLNTLFTQLIESFRNSGLYNLTTEKYKDIDPNTISGYGTNSYGTDLSIDGYDETSGGYSGASYSSTDSYNSTNSSFNLLKDLGNTYIHGEFTEIGKWNASINSAKDMSGNYFHDENGDILGDVSKRFDNNRNTSKISTYKPSLNIGIGVRRYDPSSGNYTYITPYDYYLTVTTPGTTKLFNNGYNGWAIGDRAFWNGNEWQNWKKGESNPIDKRGIIQIQKDYVVAAREILKILPSVMPKIGELDYCIPGPNPNFKSNSDEANSAFMDFASSISGMRNTNSLRGDDSINYSLAGPGDSAYDNYANIFKSIYNFFNEKVKQTQPITELYALQMTVRLSNSTGNQQSNIISNKISEITKDINNFYTSYQEMFDSDYYEKMSKEYTEYENTPTLTKNTAYIPMVQSGYAITKDMVATSEDIDEKTQDYKNNIITAESNVSKLNQIKSQVDIIIKNAQERRTQRLISKIVPIYYPKKTAETATEAEKKDAIAKYKTDYKSCFDEEYIDYLDYGDIVNNTEESGARCSDGLDNDLDGLIDSADPDCQKNGGLIEFNTNITNNNNSNNSVSNNTNNGRR